MRKKIALLSLMGALVLPSLQGCFPVVAAGAGVGVTAAVDRRTVGIQTEDETIELKAMTRAAEQVDKRAYLNFTSYNLKVLISGEVPNESVQQSVSNLALGIPNVKKIYNETVVRPASSFTDRGNDSFVTTKVKSRSLDTGKFNPLHVKVVTEAGVVYLMGMVTQREADAAIHIARTTAGVRKVVNLFEIISDERARELDRTNDQNSNNKSSEPPMVSN